MKRTIKSLLRKKKRVYVFIHSECAAQAFLALAQYEGFIPEERLQQRETVKERLIVGLNGDMTLSLIQPHNWVSAMLYHHILKGDKGRKEIFVDFETMLLS